MCKTESLNTIQDLHSSLNCLLTVFVVQVVEVVNGDALVVKTDKNLFKKVFLSSIRPPRYKRYNDPYIS